MLKLIRDLLAGGRVRPIPVVAADGPTEQVSAHAHLRLTAATFGRCR